MTYPIVLAHGVCRFDVLWQKLLDVDNNDDPVIDDKHYFKGIRTMLMRKGFTVYHSSVRWAANVEQRAADLEKSIWDILEKTKAKKVNIIAHSMGGLDARHMLFRSRNKSRIHERIASITTISTPHNGSPFADWCLKNLYYVPPLLYKLGLDVSAVNDLSTEACLKFNNRPAVKKFEQIYDNEIRFQTYAGRQDYFGVFTALKEPYYIIEKAKGENDGLVSVESAKWRKEYFKGVIDNADHLNELGWWDPSQILTGETPQMLLSRIHRLYARIAKNLP